MTPKEFKDTVSTGSMPEGLSPALQALWHDADGNWEKAHSLIDRLQDPVSAHVHAYLHRKEGDLWNADYWYSLAKQKRPDITLDEEWDMLLTRYWQR